ncbi:hypothetical protein RF11_01811 [Thelohanellus kitauei]|uniref:Uncharacterized protein n=1 Tax=Thelohanellus kitauei TaxID=669202 RepID=A0A0C2NJG6_THEKT|nr:hypothetical protein RF11_01811 [Thelohanellus kitauei]
MNHISKYLIILQIRFCCFELLGKERDSAYCGKMSRIAHHCLQKNGIASLDEKLGLPRNFTIVDSNRNSILDPMYMERIFNSTFYDTDYDEESGSTETVNDGPRDRSQTATSCIFIKES